MAKLLLLADANSIHTVRWVKGISLTKKFEIYVVNMNPKGVNPDLRMCAEKIYDLSAGAMLSSTGGNIQYLKALPALIRIAKDVRPDIINTIYLSSYGFLGSILKFLGLCDLLAHFMIGSDIMVAPDRGIVYKKSTLFSLKQGDFFISVSQSMTDKLKTMYSIPKDSLLTQQYGVSDAILFSPSQVKIFDFVSNRAWIENSNIIWFIDVFSQLNQGKLALVGNGSLRVQVESNIVNKTNIQNLGQLEFTQNIEVVAKSKFFISLVSSDGASLSLMEAMALGCIPIVSNIAPNREWVTHGENGYLVNLFEDVELLDALRLAMSLSEVDMLKMRTKNKAIILERGSFTKNMAKVCDMFETRLKGDDA
ncbi:MAG: glycosyltransferase family 4 protein [Mariprofundaceae bacterium]